MLILVSLHGFHIEENRQIYLSICVYVCNVCMCADKVLKRHIIFKQDSDNDDRIENKIIRGIEER